MTVKIKIDEQRAALLVAASCQQILERLKELAEKSRKLAEPAMPISLTILTIRAMVPADGTRTY